MKKITLGLILGNINPDFEYDITQGVNKYASEKGINVVTLVSTTPSKPLSDRVFDSYKFMGIDGLIIIYGSFISFKNSVDGQKFLDKFKNIPYVIVQNNYKVPNKSNLIVDNKKGMSKCIEHLIVDHKYKNILYVSGPKDNFDSMERLDAYIETMEKYGLTVSNNMIAYGNFSENIERSLKQLIKRNKNVDAIAFANDTMALASYPILEQLGFKIGKDIGITGFDDMYKSSIAHPSLTTVSQDPIKIGYESTKTIHNMILNGTSEFISLDTELIIRKSCGCRKEVKSIHDLKKLSEDEIIDYFIKESAINSRSNINLKLLKRISMNVLKQIKAKYTVDEIVYYIKNAIILNDESSAITNYNDICAYFNAALKKYASSVSDQTIKEKSISILYSLQTWYFSYITNTITSENHSRFDKITNISLISRKMINNQLTRTEMFDKIFVELKEMGAKSSYIYLFDNQAIENAYLAAYYNSKTTKIFKANEKRQRVYTKNLIDNESGTFCYGFSLASNEKYYGFIVCETDLSLINPIKLLCAQIGTMLYIEEMRKSELKAKHDLKKSLKLIQEKNEILNNLSLYDELTKIYNRRGFIEKSMELIKTNKDKKIEVVFCDLDHLKEINDTFGHNEGDYAISNAAKLIVASLPKNAIVSRVGGDEFVSIFVVNPKNDLNVETSIKNTFKKFNDGCNKPYFIETSIGYYDFISSEDIKIAAIINEADKYLYEAKKHRKSTIRK